MDIKFINSDSSVVNNLPIADGQIIALNDKNVLLYDMGGKRHTSGTVSVELTADQYDSLTKEQRNNGMIYCITDVDSPRPEWLE